MGPKRICTWVRLRDRPSGRVLRVYNAHLYLTESARLRAVQIILGKVGSGHDGDDVLLAGDFNATPDVPSRALLAAGGLVPEAVDLPVLRDPLAEPRRDLREPGLAARGALGC